MLVSDFHTLFTSVAFSLTHSLTHSLSRCFILSVSMAAQFLLFCSHTSQCSRMLAHTHFIHTAIVSRLIFVRSTSQTQYENMCSFKLLFALMLYVCYVIAAADFVFLRFSLLSMQLISNSNEYSLDNKLRFVDERNTDTDTDTNSNINSTSTKPQPQNHII